MIWLHAGILMAGLLYIRAAVAGNRRLVYLLKPGTMALIITLAALRIALDPSIYGWLILAGLGCSVVGDILLMLPANRFVAGLGAFLVAHLIYIAAFATAAPLKIGPAEAAVLLLLAVGSLLYGRPLLTALRARQGDRLLLPVGLYMLVINLMLWRAVIATWAPTSALFQPTLAAAGAALFCASDSVLAWDRFVRPIPGRQLLVMAPYFAAQYLLALSIG